MGVGVDEGKGVLLRPLISATSSPQGSEGVGVGVGVADGEIVGVGVGVGVIKQSKTASKSKVEHGSIVEVVVVQLPSENKLTSKSGHWENDPVGPNNKQLPPYEFDKHHCVVPEE